MLQPKWWDYGQPYRYYAAALAKRLELRDRGERSRVQVRKCGTNENYVVQIFCK